jgi:predicted transcriptional regulator of viral defense system
MNFIDFKNALQDFSFFSLSDIRQIGNIFHRTRLNEWQRKGYINKIIKGFYYFSDLELSENLLFEFANKIYSPSYISNEMAFSYYNIIPENVYGITSVSTRKTSIFKTSFAEFSYKKIKPELYFGFDLVKYNNKYFRMASLEKAILDYFYLHANIKNTDDFIELRFNMAIFLNEIDEPKLLEYLKRFTNKSLEKRINSFLGCIKNA